jgi:hypothetical protein
MATVYVDQSRLPRWRIVGAVLVSSTDPTRYGGFELDISADDDMTAMRLACREIEVRQPTVRGRPIMFTTIVRA